MKRQAARNAGFTLVEVLVALAVMALMAVMAWRGVDAMGRAQAQTGAYSDELQALQTGMAQWASDLDALTQIPPVGGLDFDGRVLRMTRQYLYDEATGAPDGARTTDSAPVGSGSLRVIAWGVRVQNDKRQWLRWQSEPLYTRAALRLAWEQAGLWGQNPTTELMRREVAITGVDDWQIFYYRNNSWSSPLSSAGGAALGASSAQQPLPDGVRLVLSLSAGQALSGRITRDWARPTVRAGRS